MTSGPATEDTDPSMTIPESSPGGSPAPLANRAVWSAAIEVLQIFSSTLVFLVLAKVLLRSEYGVMTGIMGAVLPALSLSNVGTHILLMRRAARSENLTDAWRKALTLGLAGPTLATLLMLSIHPLLYPKGNVPWSVYALFVLAGLPFFWLSEMVAFLPIGLGDLRTAAAVRAATFGCRIVALGWFLTFSAGSLIEWAAVHAVSFAVAGVLGVVIVGRRYGLVPGLASGLASDVREGLPFSMNGATENIFDGADKVLLLRYDLTDDAGIYGLGARITQFGYAPIRILLRSRDSELYRAGGVSLSAAFGVTRKMLVPGMALGVGAAVAFWICAPLVPILLNDPKWDDAVPAIRLLAFLPAIRSVQYLMGNTLSASDHQQWRFASTALAAVLNIVLNVIYLPTGTWRTAVATTFVSEVILVVTLCAVVWYWLRREPEGSSNDVDASQ